MRGTRFIKGAAAVCAVTVLAACQDDTLTDAGPDGAFNAPQLSVLEVSDAFSAMLDDMNVALAGEGADYRAVMVEYVTGAGDEAGATVISKDLGNKQLGFDFVPFDVRRAGTPFTNGGWSGSVAGPDDDITYAVDMTGDAVPPLGVLSAAQTTAAINAAMATWDGQTCSNLPITMNPDFGLDLGVILGGALVADIMHAGWGNFFGGGVLGAAFTFGFIDGSGNFTDIDNNGKLDAAFREIYYDGFFPAFPTPWPWNVDGSGIDVEAVALHEAGHGLSQAHFGNIFIKNDGSLKRAPAAIMNPFILGATRTLLGTDKGGHCSNWAQWPNN